MTGLGETVGALLAMRQELGGILGLSLLVSGAAIVAAMAIGVPAGIFLGLHAFPGRRFLVTVVNTGMGLPPVVVGLVVFLLLARSGPLGGLELLYTPSAMIVAQVVIATPLVVGITLAAVQALDPRVHLQILSLGASRRQYWWKLVQEARLSLVAALAVLVLPGEVVVRRQRAAVRHVVLPGVGRRRVGRCCCGCFSNTSAPASRSNCSNSMATFEAG